ncbi:flagellar hook assembly protein FlgD [Microvirga roseola]|uniref:flagellar hook assembly protein FlgD n=1 Tax=Microvirga roseola TaxID=2883126 RepID=UPI001E3A3ED9|nr:flagellar hook assembly protein FlgD [Microvirga roseola]
MNVPSVSSATNQYASQATSSTPTLGYDNFLKLLLTQMKNQDPTDPMKSTEYMAQLATFSQVEQTMKTNTKLDSLLAASTLTQADGVIGRTLTSADGTISGQVTSVRITSEGAVAQLAGGKELLLGPGIVIS